jgi:hypothetical protein
MQKSSPVQYTAPSTAYTDLYILQVSFSPPRNKTKTQIEIRSGFLLPSVFRYICLFSPLTPPPLHIFFRSNSPSCHSSQDVFLLVLVHQCMSPIKTYHSHASPVTIHSPATHYWYVWKNTTALCNCLIHSTTPRRSAYLSTEASKTFRCNAVTHMNVSRRKTVVLYFLNDWILSIKRILMLCSNSLNAFGGHQTLAINFLRGCIEKFPDWVDNEIYAYKNKHPLKSNTKGYGGKTH